MPKARNRKQRVTQVAKWLHYHYPCKYKVTVKWVRQIPNGAHPAGDYAEVIFPSTIILSERACRDRVLATDSLLHEWAHLLRGEGHGWGHDDAYWRIFGNIYRSYYDGHGWEASGEY